MSRHLTNHQHKTRLVAVFLFTVLLALTFYVYKGRMHPATSLAAKQSQDDMLFMGLRHATRAEIKTALPEAAGKPALIDFSSRLCHDCQRLAPVLTQLMPKHPNVVFKRIDVLEDRQKYPAILRVFKPVSVPVLVFISPQGDIRNVLYDYQTPQAVSAALQALEASSAKSSPNAKK